MKLNFLLKAFILSMILIWAFPVLGQKKSKKKLKYTPVENITREDAWPIVALLIKNQRLGVERFDYGKGELLTTYLEYKKGFIPNRGKLLFNLNQGKLEIRVVQLQLKDAQTKKWKPTAPDPLFPKEKQIKAEMAEKVRLIQANDETKKQALETFSYDLYFHQSFYKTATELAGELWFDQFLKEKKLAWTATLDNIKKSEQEGYKFEELLSYSKNNKLQIKRYTNSDANAFTNTGDKIKIQGICTKAMKTEDGWVLIIEDK
ncbi:MAG: hypothetical protein MRZ79_05445 [Bacteroidia bacterium]|nr:hypothetical protein [Bacteroidia bacterium]